MVKEVPTYDHFQGLNFGYNRLEWNEIDSSGFIVHKTSLINSYLYNLPELLRSCFTMS